MSKGTEAEKLFKEGYNCSQAVIGAFCDELNLDRETAFKIASSFGGGMGRMREVCGAVSGMFMVAGLKLGYTDPTDNDAKKAHYALIQKMAKKFKEENGAIVCRELLGETADTGSTPTPRTENFYKKRPCGEYVRIAADIAEAVINEMDI